MVDKNKIIELGRHWHEVVELAKKYGFICEAYGGAAILLMHKNQLEAVGEEKYLDRQKIMFGNNMENQKE